MSSLKDIKQREVCGTLIAGVIAANKFLACGSIAVVVAAEIIVADFKQLAVELDVSMIARAKIRA